MIPNIHKAGVLLACLPLLFLGGCRRQQKDASPPPPAEAGKPERKTNAEEPRPEFESKELGSLAERGKFAEALRLIQEGKVPAESAMSDFQVLFERWCEADAQGALDACLELPEKRRRLALRVIISRLSKSDPESAWNLVQGIPDEDIRNDALESCAVQIGHWDWREAFRLLSREGNSDEGNKALSLGFVTGVRAHLILPANRNDLPGLERTLKDLLSGRGPAQFDGSLRGSVVEALGRIAAARNEPWSEAPSLARDPKERARFASGVASELISRFGGRRAEGAAVILRDDGPVARAVLPKYIDQWAKEDPRQATKFFFEDPEYRSETHADRAFSVWLDSDVSSAARWLSRQEPDSARDPLVVRLVDSLVRLGERPLAASWAESIRQPDLRRKCMERHRLSEPGSNGE